MHIHEVYNKTGGNIPQFWCRACDFFGSLKEAIEHAVTNQFRV